MLLIIQPKLYKLPQIELTKELHRSKQVLLYPNYKKVVPLAKRSELTVQ